MNEILGFKISEIQKLYLKMLEEWNKKPGSEAWKIEFNKLAEVIYSVNNQVKKK